MSERCETCGQRVTLVTDPEGTSHYEGVAEREVERLREALSRIRDAGTREVMVLHRDGTSSSFPGLSPEANVAAETLTPPARVNEEDGS